MQFYRPFRFGIVTHNNNPSLDALVARARLAEHLGYSTFLIPDHLGDQFDTPLALALVAQATTTLRIGSFVFFNDTATTEIYALSLHDSLDRVGHAMRQ